MTKRQLFLVAVAVIGLSAVALVALAIASPGANLGTVPDWVGAISTLMAFIAAVVAGWFAYGAFKLQERQERDRIEANRRRQAECVVAWFNHGGHGDGHGGPEVMFFNGSGLPVWEVEMHLSHGPKRDIAEIGFQPPTSEPVNTNVWAWDYDHRYSYGIVIEFRDAAGMVWRRDSAGFLHLVGEYEIPLVEPPLFWNKTTGKATEGRFVPPSDGLDPT